MCSGVVNDTALPVTDATSSIWPTGRSYRVNQPRPGPPLATAALVPQYTYVSSVVSSTTTSCPGTRPAALATRTDVAPRAASAASGTEPASSSHRCPINTSGFALVVVFFSRV